MKFTFESAKFCYIASLNLTSAETFAFSSSASSSLISTSFAAAYLFLNSASPNFNETTKEG